MDAVLGLDAAWTETKPSGVALVSRSDEAWRCVGLAPSYEAFTKLVGGHGVDCGERLRGSKPDPAALLRAAKATLRHHTVTIVAVDMPIANSPINGRRKADDAVSEAFGGKGCGTHSPSPQRPGPLSKHLTQGFKKLHYPLATTETRKAGSGNLIEVYPHPALLKLLGADYRIPYKVAKSTRYWRNASITMRKENLLREYQRIVDGLRREIEGIELELPGPNEVDTLASLKPYEDALDALVCAWVGIKYLQDEAKPYGDGTAAIWIPE